MPDIVLMNSTSKWWLKQIAISSTRNPWSRWRFERCPDFRIFTICETGTGTYCSGKNKTSALNLIQFLHKHMHSTYCCEWNPIWKMSNGEYRLLWVEWNLTRSGWMNASQRKCTVNTQIVSRSLVEQLAMCWRDLYCAEGIYVRSSGRFRHPPYLRKALVKNN